MGKGSPAGLWYPQETEHERGADFRMTGRYLPTGWLQKNGTGIR